MSLASPISLSGVPIAAAIGVAAFPAIPASIPSWSHIPMLILRDTVAVTELEDGFTSATDLAADRN